MWEATFQQAKQELSRVEAHTCNCHCLSRTLMDQINCYACACRMARSRATPSRWQTPRTNLHRRGSTSACSCVCVVCAMDSVFISVVLPCFLSCFSSLLLSFLSAVLLCFVSCISVFVVFILNFLV